MKRSRIAVLAAALFLGSTLGSGIAVFADQTHMNNALASLNTPLSELKIAERDKGGHRGRAANLVRQAIAEVQAGIQAGAGK